jgi:hypothetical protein
VSLFLEVVAIQETGAARRWFKLSIPGSRTGCEVSGEAFVGEDDNSVDGNAREER